MGNDKNYKQNLSLVFEEENESLYIPHNTTQETNGVDIEGTFGSKDKEEIVTELCDARGAEEALPVSKTDAFSRSNYEAPVGEIEEELARIWSSILNIGRIGRHDNFFDLGGNSLQATRIINNIYDVFGIELPIRTIFELQTIKALAEEINNIYEEVLGDEMDEGII